MSVDGPVINRKTSLGASELGLDQAALHALQQTAGVVSEPPPSHVSTLEDEAHAEEEAHLSAERRASANMMATIMSAARRMSAGAHLLGKNQASVERHETTVAVLAKLKSLLAEPPPQRDTHMIVALIDQLTPKFLMQVLVLFGGERACGS